MARDDYSFTKGQKWSRIKLIISLKEVHDMSRPKDCGEWDNYPKLKRNDELTAKERIDIQEKAKAAKLRLEKEFGFKISVAGIDD